MNYITIENKLYDIQQRAFRYSDMAKAERASLDDIAAIMGQPVSWAPDLPLGADGWVGEFYKKD